MMWKRTLKAQEWYRRNNVSIFTPFYRIKSPGVMWFDHKWEIGVVEKDRMKARITFTLGIQKKKKKDYPRMLMPWRTRKIVLLWLLKAKLRGRQLSKGWWRTLFLPMRWTSVHTYGTDLCSQFHLKSQKLWVIFSREE